MIINDLSLNLEEFSQLVVEISIIVGLLLLISLGLVFILFKLLKPIFRLLNMDKIIGDNSRDLDFSKDRHLFYKFYLMKSKRGNLLLYIGDKNKKLNDGKRITEKFFVFREKDN